MQQDDLWNEVRKAVADLKMVDYLSPSALDALEQLILTLDKLDPPVDNPKEACMGDECYILCSFPLCVSKLKG